ncbi:MAG: pentapeptide repeat-containing protein [Cyanobacteria bacterium J06639_1]
MGNRMREMTLEEFLKMWEMGTRDFSQDSMGLLYFSFPNHFYGLDMSGINLSGQRLSDFDFGRANLSGANLSGASFCDSSLVKVNLSGANLSGVTFAGAGVSDCNLRDAILKDSYIGSADFMGNDLTRCDMTGAIFEEAYVIDNIYMETIMPDGTIRTDT